MNSFVRALALGSLLVASTAFAEGDGFTAGTYTSPDGLYSVRVTLKDGKLELVEPNRTTVYEKAADGSFQHLHSNGTTYGIRIMDAKTIESFKPGTDAKPARFGLTKAAEDRDPAREAKVIKIEFKGKTYHATSEIPANIPGTYLYEGEGEPVVELSADGTGYFQPHGVPKIRVRYWIRTNMDGEHIREDGGDQGYQIQIVARWEEPSDANRPVGEYTFWPVTVRLDQGKIYILGERTKPL